MILTADYHTHTKYSHGKGRVDDNAHVASEINLKEIAITDHGFNHPAFGLRKRKVPSLIKDCADATEKYGVKVLVGVEANIISDDGKSDLSPKLYDSFDVFLAGMHKFVAYYPASFFKYFIPNFINDTFKTKPAKWLVKETTKAYINLIKKCPVDAISHLNFCCFADAEEVAKVASDYGTYIELNSKKTHLSEAEIEAVLKTDVKFIVDSDAHSPSRVGEVSLVEDLILKTGFPTERIMNIDGRLPSFRFKAFKNGVKNDY